MTYAKFLVQRDGDTLGRPGYDGKSRIEPSICRAGMTARSSREQPKSVEIRLRVCLVAVADSQTERRIKAKGRSSRFRNLHSAFGGREAACRASEQRRTGAEKCWASEKINDSTCLERLEGKNQWSNGPKVEMAGRRSGEKRRGGEREASPSSTLDPWVIPTLSRPVGVTPTDRSGSILPQDYLFHAIMAHRLMI